MNDFNELDHLLDLAADGFRPSPNGGRLESMIARRAARRRAAAMVGSAAAIALLASTAYAFRGGDERGRLNPAETDNVSITTATTEPATTEATEPTTTAVEVDATEPKVTEPAAPEPKPTNPTTTAAPTTTEHHYELQASQSYGSCAEDPPYDIFYGYTKPGGKVVIESPYSERVEIHADGNGHWEVQVFFTTAPVDTPFTVHVISGPYTREFTFTHVSS